MRKIGLVFSLVFLLLLQISFISAINLDIKEKEVTSIAIIGIDKPAIFDLTIKNLENQTDTFEIYSLVGKVDLQPDESFAIGAGEAITFPLEVYPRNNPGYFSFEYKIKNSKDEIQTDSLAINIVELGGAFDLSASDLAIDASKAVVYLKNKGGHEINSLEIELSSIFFNHKETISLEPFEEEKIEITFDKEKAKSVLAGPYILNAKFKTQGITGETSTIIRYTEQTGISTEEKNEGFFVRKNQITKTNKGNVKTEIEVVVIKDIFSSMFTSLNMRPSNKDTVGLNKYYIFEQTLDPNESLEIIAKTNWWVLMLIIFGVWVAIYLSKKYGATKIKLTKKVSFVKTKGGEFALKVSIVVYARDFIERIKVVDKLPGMVKLYERYGTITPDRVDHKNKRIEWDIESLNAGEERVFSYIIYSKIGVLGKFELPEAKATYEYKGKLKEATSNRSFFINEPDQKKPQIQRMVDDLL